MSAQADYELHRNLPRQLAQMASSAMETLEVQSDDTEQPPSDQKLKDLLSMLVGALDSMTELTTKMWDDVQHKSESDSIEQVLRQLLLSQSGQATLLKELSGKLDKLVSLPTQAPGKGLPLSGKVVPSQSKVWTVRSPGRLLILPEQQESGGAGNPKLRRQRAQQFARERSRSRSSSETIRIDLSTI